MIIKAGVTVRSSPTRASTSDVIEPDSCIVSNVPTLEDSSISEDVEAHLLSGPKNADVFDGFEKLVAEVNIQFSDCVLGGGGAIYIYLLLIGTGNKIPGTCW